MKSCSEIWQAVEKNDLALVRKLLESKAEVNYRYEDHEGDSLLHSKPVKIPGMATAVRF